MKTNPWVLGACAGATLAALAAVSCSSDEFESCQDSRTCPEEDAGSGGNAGVGGSGGSAASGGDATGGDPGAGGGDAGAGGTDDVPPTVLTMSPDRDEVDVAPSASVLVTFSEPLAATSVNATSFVVKDDAGAVVPGTVSYEDARATFAPDQPLALTAPYTATLSSAVVDLAGNALEEVSWTFTVRDGSWSAPVLLETNSGSASWPRVAVNAGGDATAVWIQSDGVRDNVWSSRYIAGEGWQLAELIETDNAGSAMQPAVVVDASGNAVAAWYQPDGTALSVWANRYVAGTGWTGAETIETQVGQPHSEVRLAIDGGGNVIAIWSQPTEAFNGDSIWVNRYVPGVGWGTAQVIETANAHAVVPRIAMNVSGRAVAVWRQQDGPQNLWSSQFQAEVGWGLPGLVELAEGNIGIPEVAIDGAGSPLTIWDQVEGTLNDVWAGTLAAPAGTSWNATKLDGPSAGHSFVPQLAMNAKGDALAAWFRQPADGTRTDIWAAQWRRGGLELPAVLVETNDEGNAESPHVGVDERGNGAAVWQQLQGATWSIWVNRFSVKNGWGTPQLLEMDDSGNASGVSVEFDGRGNGIAIWGQSDGARSNIWASTFAGD